MADNTELTPLQQALVAVRTLRARLAEAEGPKRAPVAIVGMAARLPGAPSTAAYWRLLEARVTGVGPLPEERRADWGDGEVPVGGFLADVAGFDAALFGISALEAAAMDPQQRLLLELAWEALEDAGIAPDGLTGSRTGVYTAAGLPDYARRHLWSEDPGRLDVYGGTGALGSVTAGRISYALGLTGPTLLVDTACSSFLVGLHLAAAALRGGECERALVGAVNLVISPQPTAYFDRLDSLAHSGSCRPFAADADGYVRGEGGAVVVLERLSDAEKARRRVHALVVGSSVGHGGRTNGLTAPSGRAQREAMTGALAQAGVAGSDVGFIEAHGTASPLGDRVEMEALQAVYGEGEQRCAIGGGKANVGNLEPASGAAAVVKAVLALGHGAIPGQPEDGGLDPRLKLAGTRLEVPRANLPWPAGGRARYAAVNSYGLSGTDAHVVLQEAPRTDDDETTEDEGEHLLTLSAASPEALRALAGRLAHVVGTVPLASLCFTQNTGRAVLAHRAALVAGDDESARGQLTALAAGEPTPPIEGPLAELAQRFVAGESVDFAAFHRHRSGGTATVATYPFQRQRYWIDASPGTARPAPAAAAGRALDPAEASRLVSGEVRDILGNAAPAELEVRAPLTELGLDSIMAVELRNRLNSAAAVTLPLSLFMERPSIDRLAAAVVDAQGGQRAAGGPVDGPLPEASVFGTHAAAALGGATLFAAIAAIWRWYGGG